MSNNLLLEIKERFAMGALFEQLNPNEQAAMAAGLKEVQLNKGAYLFRQNEAPKALYFVMEGTLQKEITKSDNSIVKTATINLDNPVGEVQILTGIPYSFSAYALEGSRLIQWDKSSYDELIQNNSAAEKYFLDFFKEYMRQGLLGGILANIFETVDPQIEKDIEDEIEWVHLHGGKTLFKQGDQSDAMYVVLSGCLQNTVITSEGKMKDMGEIKRGESLGVTGLITEGNYISTIHAIRDSELGKLSKASFEKLTNKYPILLRQMARRIALRLINQAGIQKKTQDKEVTIALIPISKDVPIKDFVLRLEKALDKLAPTIPLDSDTVDTQLGLSGIAQTKADAPNDIRVTTWLNNLETEHRFMLYIGDDSPTEWTKRCMRQAEHIFLVGNPSETPTLSEIEKLYLQKDQPISIAKQALVLLHPDGNKLPSGTQKWLDERNVEIHHHIRLDREGDIERLSRFIAGTAIGLALGGGGARGFAHIGLLKVMQELDIPIDIIGGTSMGSYISGEYVLGWEEKEMIEKSKQIFNLGVYDLTLPLTSAISGRKLANRLKNLFGEIEIPDMWLPYFCVSSNISRGEMVVHRTGKLWRGMRASGGVQGIVPPVVYEGDLLVDGALLSNLPADAMKMLHPNGIIIAVDVSPPEDLVGNENYGDSLSGWKILWSKISPWRKKITMPSLGTIMQRSSELASQARQKNAIHNMTDVYVKMPVAEFDLLAFGKADEIIAVGYEHAQKILHEWINE